LRIRNHLVRTVYVQQIWDHDIHLTDDFIGEAVIELRDLEPEPYEPKAQVVAQNAKWFQLRRSAVDDRDVGQLKVAFRLIMNAENVSPEQFKQMAAKATEVERKRTESFSSNSAPATAETAMSRDRKFTFDEVVDGDGELATIDEEDRDSVSSQVRGRVVFVVLLEKRTRFLICIRLRVRFASAPDRAV
jgi:hypothetical protein